MDDEKKFDLEHFPTSESAKRQLSYVSDSFYDESYVGKWLFQVMGIEYDKAREILEDLPNQFIPETATWGLRYHEEKWGLPVRENLSYEERRRLIYQKRDYRAPMTPYRMEQYLSDATGFKVFIADINDPGEYGWIAPHPNVFKAFFQGEGTLDSKKAHEMLNKLKQSHTTYTVNDRSEFEIDNRDLEEFDLKRIIFQIGFSFWDEKIFDGTWMFDGSVILNGNRRYGLRLGFKYRMGAFNTEEYIKLKSVLLRAKLNTDNSLDAGVRNRFGIDFWQAAYFDGRWMFDGSKLLGSHRGNTKAGLILHSSFLSNSESIRYIPVPIVLKADIEEQFKAKVINHFGIDFWQLHYLEGSWMMDGSYLLDSHRGSLNMALQFQLEVKEPNEQIDNVEVITKTPDYWFFDGTLDLDGSRAFNSIYRKEVIE